MSDSYPKVDLMKGKGWYVALGRLDYLHRDGVKRMSTMNLETGEWSGYFQTRDDAEAALDDWHAKQPGQQAQLGKLDRNARNK